MTDLYDVLKVSRGAPPEEIDLAYLARRRELADDDRDGREQLEAAYSVLGNATRRAEYDATNAGIAPSADPGVLDEAVIQPGDSLAAENGDVAAAEPGVVPQPLDRIPGTEPPSADVFADSIQLAPEMPAARAPHQQPSSGRGGMIAVLAGMIFLLIAGIGAALAYVVLSGNDDDRYPSDLSDDAYPLEAMGLAQEDMPRGMQLPPLSASEIGLGTVKGNGIEFTNEEWAQLLDETDPEAKANQLGALGRVKGYIQFFSAEPIKYGYPIEYRSQSSLFDDEDSAVEAMRTDCDILRDPALSIDDIRIGRFADESTAFEIRTPTAPVDSDEYIGDIVETVVCFRTGRIVHSVLQRGFEGTEDLGLVLRLARTMLDHVDQTFGNDPG